MKEKIQALIYTARWALTEALSTDKYSLLAFAVDRIAEAQALAAIDDDEPERPNVAPVISGKYYVPKIEVVSGVKFKTHGKFKTPSGQARGLVVHYTVSGRTAKSARGVVGYLASKGLGCLVMDEDGVIYAAQGYDFMTDVVYHAGPSLWKGKSGVSSYSVGMEICCWGRESKVGPFRESKGDANIKKGKYQAYTQAQEDSLKNFILWQLDVNKEFNVDWIVGHDEIAPNRKTDPGASLSMTMPKFREKLLKAGS